MAIPVFLDSISSSHPFFHSSRPFLLSGNLIPKKYNCLCFSSSQFNPLHSEVSFCVGTHLIPHPLKIKDDSNTPQETGELGLTSPKKVERGGEDAFLVSSYNGGVIAVADGVSGWAEKNVDPSLFPQELMANASYFMDDEEVNYDPQILIQKAHAATSSIGSATVIIAMLERNGKLKIASVGDCGLRVIRKGEVIFSTPAQEHYFDCPYQLSSEPVGQTYIDAMVGNVELMEGDTIVMGSDGLFDNVFDYEIVSTIARHRDVTEAAKALANLASIHSMDSEFESPYVLEARSKGIDLPLWKKILGMKLTGGKLDDITVVVGRVVRSQQGLKGETNSEER